MPSNKSRNYFSTGIFNELAARNVKKSAKDYFVYFFTLMLSVSLFYSFNSVSTQFASLGLEDRLSYLSFSSSILTAFSILVCFIMGGLVVYANRFLLRRRKKEMGIYATLGMKRGDLNNLLMRETLRIGVVSLIAGLILGIFTAQILSLLTAKLAGISLSSYRFMISGKAIVLSILFFGILFIIVHLFNVRELKKMSLLEMLYADRKNEDAEGRKRGTAFLSGILSLVLIFGGYGIVFIVSESDIAKALGLGGLMLILGTMLFFSSVFRIKARFMKMNKITYFRGLNMFTASQFATRLKTDSRSGGMIGILLFLSLSLTMLGPGLGKYVMNGVEYADPFSGTIIYGNQGNGDTSRDMVTYLKESGFDINAVSDKYEGAWMYQLTGNGSEENYKPIDKYAAKGSYEPGYDYEMENEFDHLNEVFMEFIGADDYNRIMVLQGREPVTLGENEFALSYAFPGTEKKIKEFQSNPKPVTIGDRELCLAENGVYRNALETSNVLSGPGIVIIPQNLTQDLKPVRWILNFDLSDEGKEANDNLYRLWYQASADEFQMLAAEEAIISLTADNLLTTYLGIYLGITFLITSGAVLALQQMSQAADNVKRYELLRKLGASKKDMRRSLTKQLRVYFGLPMIIAVLHSAVAVSLVFRFFEGLAPGIIVSIIGISFLLILAVYAVYFVATYTGSRRILRL